MKRQLCLITFCFIAAMLGAIVGNDISTPPASPTIVSNVGISTASTVQVAPKQAATNNPVILAIRKVGPAVVNIDTVVMRRQSIFGFSDQFEDMFESDPFMRMVPSQGQGSGFIIDGDKGYILTNDHVVHDAIAQKGQIRVSLPDKQTFEATVVGSDPQYDVALIKIDGKNLPEVALSASDVLTIGEPAIAIGNPFGFRNSVTVGVISAVDRTLQTNNETSLEGLIQTDAAINPGNSGGPLCDIEGRVIGINTAILNGAEGLGFAMGASSIKPVVDEIIKYGHVRHGWSGMTFWDISKRLANRLALESTDGALVAEVYRSSPAEEGGIKAGDVVIKANGVEIASAADVQSVLRKARAGDSLSITLSRKGEKISKKIKLVDKTSNE